MACEYDTSESIPGIRLYCRKFYNSKDDMLLCVTERAKYIPMNRCSGYVKREKK